ncbi:hypothetical protein [Nocardia fluminea]
MVAVEVVRVFTDPDGRYGAEPGLPGTADVGGWVSGDGPLR